MQTLGTVFAAECPGETTIKSKEKQNRGILKISAHKKYVWLLMQLTRLDSVVAGLSLVKPSSSYTKLLACNLA